MSIEIKEIKKLNPLHLSQCIEISNCLFGKGYHSEKYFLNKNIVKIVALKKNNIIGFFIGKKEIKNGIVVSISTFEDKVGVAIGVTNNLVSKYDAVNLVKIASEILDGKGGGGRKDFAQAGGSNKSKINDAFKSVVDKIS